MRGQQDRSIDPSRHHIDEAITMPAGREAMAILIRNLTKGQKGISKPMTTTGVAEVVEISDIKTPFFRE
jgi:hypothetical protein